ncbi:unnamed protein product [Gulo gulo]|uniref:Uncharacterized protein n=1 Tax=Gulo gulo TaxID=48420 RepID=A0A9X9LQJ7_GULGU|nr:unnamed protein product [Gulo gulo]
MASNPASDVLERGRQLSPSWLHKMAVGDRHTPC